MDIILKLSIVLAVGILGGKLANLLKLPNVSGYLIVGLLLGPSFFHLITEENRLSLEFISEIALAFIAFSIGSEFEFKQIVKYGKDIFVITLLEVVGAVVVVFVVMRYMFGQPFPFSIVIASMSAATAPAATLLVMKQYKASGPLTRTVLPVVALDDVFGIIAFGIAMALAKAYVFEKGLSFSSAVIGPSIEIFGSLALGTIIGLLLSLVFKMIKAHDDFQVISLTAIALGMGMSDLLNLSPLLTNIMIGTTLVNFMPKSERAFKSINNFVPVFYVLFFTLAGASLNISILWKIGLVGVGYVFARGIGKALGAWLGCVSVKTEKTVSRYIGLTLLPQGGISIGLSVLVVQQLPDYAADITTIIMASILIYETLGPIFAKIAIYKAGEINGGIEGEDIDLTPELNLEGSEA